MVIRQERLSTRAAKAQFFVFSVHAVQLEGFNRPFQNGLYLFARRKPLLLGHTVEMHSHFDFVTGVVMQVVFVLHPVVAETGVMFQGFLAVLDHDNHVRVVREADFSRGLNQVMNSRGFGNCNDLFLNSSRAVEVDFNYVFHFFVYKRHGVEVAATKKPSHSIAKSVKQIFSKIKECRVLKASLDFRFDRVTFRKLTTKGAKTCPHKA